MDERNIDKVKEEISLQAYLNERYMKAKEKWSMNKGRGKFKNFGGRES